jgi:hypothetical protein
VESLNPPLPNKDFFEHRQSGFHYPAKMKADGYAGEKENELHAT